MIEQTCDVLAALSLEQRANVSAVQLEAAARVLAAASPARVRALDFDQAGLVQRLRAAAWLLRVLAVRSEGAP